MHKKSLKNDQSNEISHTMFSISSQTQLHESRKVRQTLDSNNYNW